MRISLMMVFLLAFCTGCVDALQDAANPPGEMRPDGRINPCHGWESDKQLCGDSKFFAKRIVLIEIGQTKDRVRELMMRDPWRRELDGNREMWGYSTSYEDERMAWIIFEDGQVVRVTESSWEGTPIGTQPQ